MGDCPMIGACIFFTDQMPLLPDIVIVMKDKYCRNNFESCARYIVNTALGKGNVPNTLYPFEISKVEGIIADSKTKPPRE